MTSEEIRQRILDEKKDVQRLRFQHAVAQLENPAVLRQKRREIARLTTILGERGAAESAGKTQLTESNDSK